MSYLDLAKRAEARLTGSTVPTDAVPGRASRWPAGPAGTSSRERSEQSEGTPIAERAAIFRQVIDDWVRSGRIALPVVALPDAPNLGHGYCVSCAVSLVEDETWRCATCVAALNVVLSEMGRAS